MLNLSILKEEKTIDTIYLSILIYISLLFIFLELKYFSSVSIWPDEALYIWFGESIHKFIYAIFKKEIISYHLPLYSIFLAILQIFFKPIISAKAMSIAFGVGGILIMYALGKVMFNRFVGLAASTMLAFNYFYQGYSNRALIDVPFTVMLVLFIYFLANTTSKETGKISYGILAAITGIAMMGMKRIGVSALFISVLYYIAICYIEKEPPTRTKELQQAILIMAFTVIIIAAKYILLGSPLSNISATHFMELFWNYLSHFPSFVEISQFILFLIGAAMFIRIKNKTKWLILSWFISFLFVLSLGSGKIQRIFLPAIPAVFLIGGIGLDKILELLLRNRSRYTEAAKLFSFFILYIVVIFQSVLDEPLKYSETRRYTGYEEACQWIKDNDTENTVIFSGSPRTIRLFSGIELVENGGRISPIPDSTKEFEKAIRDKKDVMVEIDVWDFGQPKWVFPITRETIRYFSVLGMKNIFIIRTPFETQYEKRGQPVIFLFRLKH